MTQPSHINKITKLYALLFELATGGAAVAVEGATGDDAYDTLLASFSRLGARLQALLEQGGMAPPLYRFQPVAPFAVLLDSDGRISAAAPAVPMRLGVPPEGLRGRLFADLLDPASRPAWEEAARLPGDDPSGRPADLMLRTSKGTRLPLCCWIMQDMFKDFIFVVAVEATLRQAAVLEEYAAVRTTAAEASATLARKVQAHILGQLGQPLPSGRALARLYGTDEFYLRRAFREQYHCSPYQYYQEQRLHRAWLLIRHTGLSLQDIAFRCGFDLYGNFYRAFRKRYGCPPSGIAREGM